MTSQTSITATPNPQSVFWFDNGSHAGAVDRNAGPSVVLSPMQLLEAYLKAQTAAPIRVEVEHLVDPAPDSQACHFATAKAITKAHEDSGLTWEQLGRVFGVSRRAVHMWATGGRMNSTNAELLMRFVDVLKQLNGSPDECRAALLAIGPNGDNVLDAFRGQYSNADRRFDSLPRPDSLLGALHDDVAE